MGVKIGYVGLRRGLEPLLEGGKKDVEKCWKLRRAKKWRGFTRRPPESPREPQEAPRSPQEKREPGLGSLKGIQETATGLTD